MNNEVSTEEMLEKENITYTRRHKDDAIDDENKNNQKLKYR